MINLSSTKINKIFSNLSPIKFFIFTAAAFGLIFILITPPFQTPDEPAHFLRTYQISEGQFAADSEKSDNKVGTYLPATLNETIDITSKQPIIKFLPGVKYDIGKTKTALELRLESNDKMFYENANIAQYSPVNYVMQTIGVFVGKLFSAPPILLLYIARCMNLITWIILFAVVIKLLPIKKWIAVYIGLLPMALFQAAGLNADVTTMGVSAIFVAYILRVIWQRRQLTNKDFILLSIIGSAMALSKPSMIVFLPLILLISSKQLINPNKQKYKAYIIKLILIFLPVLILRIWLMANQGGGAETSDAVNGANPSGQLNFLLHSPLSFINVMWNTYFFTWGDTITRSFIGGFGWADTPLPENIATLGYIGLAFIFLLDTGEKFKQWLTKQQKIFMGIILLAYWAGVSAALYLYYSPVGFKIIVGLQGRYLLPLLVPLIPVLQNKRLKTDPTTYKKIAVCTPIFLLVCSVITIYFRYYINNV